MATRTTKRRRGTGPHKGWFDRCVAGVKKSGSADDPEAVCGSVLKRKRAKGNPKKSFRFPAPITGGHFTIKVRKVHPDGTVDMQYSEGGIGADFRVTSDNSFGGHVVSPYVRTRAIEVAGIIRGRKRNPDSAAASMYSSFHGTPSTAIDEYVEKEHYHSNLAALGELVGLKVRTVSGYDVTLGFDASGSGRESNPGLGREYTYPEESRLMGSIAEGEMILRSKRAGSGRKMSEAELSAVRRSVDNSKRRLAELQAKNDEMYGKSNPNRQSNIWPFSSFTRTTIMHVPSGHKFHTTTRHKGHTIYKSESKDGYVVPGIERDSVFDTVKDAKKFIDHWVKSRPNPLKPVSMWRVSAFSPGKGFHSEGTHKFSTRAEAEKYFNQLYDEGYKVVLVADDEEVRQVARMTPKDAKIYAVPGRRLNPKHKGRSVGPFASSQHFVGDTIGTIYRPIDEFTGFVTGALDKGLGRVGLKGNPAPTYDDVIAAERRWRKAADTGYGRSGRTSPSQIEKTDQRIRRLKEKYEEVARAYRASQSSNPRRSNPDHVLLCSTEDGNNLQLIGGDQSLDLDSLKITGPLAEKELVTVGEVWGLNYRTEKVFGDGDNEDGLTEYIHILGPKETKPPRGGDLWQDAVPPRDTTFGTGELPTLVYDKRNQKLTLSGGMYHINQPLMGTSPGIEN